MNFAPARTGLRAAGWARDDRGRRRPQRRRRHGTGPGTPCAFVCLFNCRNICALNSWKHCIDVVITLNVIVDAGVPSAAAAGECSLLFCAIFTLNTINLPRQAREKPTRDKRSGNQKRDLSAFCAGERPLRPAARRLARRHAPAGATWRQRQQYAHEFNDDSNRRGVGRSRRCSCPALGCCRWRRLCLCVNLAER